MCLQTPQIAAVFLSFVCSLQKQHGMALLLFRLADSLETMRRMPAKGSVIFCQVVG
jgi:hypothetical protein